MCETMTEERIAFHPFEKAGLGLAPFRMTGFQELVYVACHGAPKQPGGSCDYCYTAIMYACVITSADGKKFKVGCDCVAKLEREDNRLFTAMESRRKAHEKALRDARKPIKLAKEKATIAEARERLSGPETRERLASQPHPTIARLTLLDYAEWMFAHAGHSGRLKTAKVILK